jgi:hemoglobin
MDLLDTQIFPLVGEEGFARLVAGFYRRVPADDLLGPLYPPQDMAGAERRLRDFLVMRFGGPERYAQTRGHPRLRMRHGRFTIDQAARDRWVSLMEAALEESDLPESVRPTLRRFFHDAATFLINRESPRARSGEAGA